ncbi:hypothetical protein [Micromonospora globbae]|jgi:hypothetical protein|uniref:Uncharacterized protein n=1 Tax=Micromonospora globbae TaxID=1894969 RepID=A0A420ET99_9ACTN|nr:hypothetical protein [Micromonospora globbae]RKF23880.1 hypothetical protein D7I43_29200 [Micromonospora globbae]
MPTVIVPVGLNLGPSYRYVTPPDSEPEFYRVRLGQEFAQLSVDEFKVWGRAFLDPERHARLQVNRGTLRDDVVAAGNGPAQPEQVIEGLLEQGLLVEFDPDGSLEKVFRQLKLFPTAEGMGNTPDEPGWERIGHNGQPLLKVSATVYGIWAFSSTEESLWAACSGLAEDAEQGRAEGEELDSLTADEAAKAIAGNLPLLVAAGCAVLDKTS